MTPHNTRANKDTDNGGSIPPMLTNDSTKYICQGIIDDRTIYDRTIYDRTVKGETEIGNGGLHIVKITHEFISGENVEGMHNLYVLNVRNAFQSVRKQCS